MLRILTVSCINLDCMLYMESNFLLSEVLIKKFEDFVVDDEIIADEEYLYWRYIKGLTTELGGFSEKKSYKLTLGDVSEFTSVKISTNVTSKQSLALSSYLEEKEKIIDIGWIEKVGSMLRDILILTNTPISKIQTREILEKVAIVNSKTHSEAVGNETNIIQSNEDIIANKLMIEYGEKIAALDGHCDHRADLKEVLTLSRSMYSTPGYDWFVSAVFLMTGGNVLTTKSLLRSLPGTLVSPYLWRNHGATQFPQPFHLATLGHCVEMILEEDVPALAATLHMLKVPSSVITDLWLRQCFINILDFQEVTNYVLMALIFGVDYIVYFCVSLLSHLQEEVLGKEEDINLFQRIVTLTIQGFRAGDYLPFMDSLAKKHRSRLMQYFTDMVKKE